MAAHDPMDRLPGPTPRTPHASGSADVGLPGTGSTVAPDASLDKTCSDGGSEEESPSVQSDWLDDVRGGDDAVHGRHADPLPERSVDHRIAAASRFERHARNRDLDALSRAGPTTEDVSPLRAMAMREWRARQRNWTVDLAAPSPYARDTQQRPLGHSPGMGWHIPAAIRSPPADGPPRRSPVARSEDDTNPSLSGRRAQQVARSAWHRGPPGDRRQERQLYGRFNEAAWKQGHDARSRHVSGGRSHDGLGYRVSEPLDGTRAGAEADVRAMRAALDRAAAQVARVRETARTERRRADEAEAVAAAECRRWEELVAAKTSEVRRLRAVARQESRRATEAEDAVRQRDHQIQELLGELSDAQRVRPASSPRASDSASLLDEALHKLQAAERQRDEAEARLAALASANKRHPSAGGSNTLQQQQEEMPSKASTMVLVVGAAAIAIAVLVTRSRAHDVR